MQPPRKTASPLLSFQVVALVVLAVVLLARIWLSKEVEDSTVVPPRSAYQSLLSQTRSMTVAPYRFAATRDPRMPEQTRVAAAQATAALELIGPTVDGTRPSVEKVRRSINDLQVASGLFYNSGPTADLTGAYEEMSAAEAELTEALATLGRQVREHEDAFFAQSTWSILIICAGMLVIALSTSLMARSRGIRNADAERHALESAVNGIAEALRRAVEGRETTALPKHTGLSPVLSAATQAISALEDLRVAKLQIERSTNFARETIDALSLAEDERGALEAGARAGRQAYPDAHFQLLVMDPLTGLVSLQDTHAGAACQVSDSKECPAARGARPLNHKVEGMGRCARLKDGAGAVACVPVVVKGEVNAVAQVGAYPERFTRLEDLEVLSLALGSRWGLIRDLAGRPQEGTTDSLTGLMSRKRLLDRINRLDMADQTYAVIHINLDLFAAINATHGQPVGDRCLQAVSKAMREACRDSDLPARVGGDELVMVLPQAGMRAGLAVAMRFRSYLVRQLDQEGLPRFTASIGIATRPDHGRTVDGVMRAAEQAAFDAKDAGRDQIVPASTHSALDDDLG